MEKKRKKQKHATRKGKCYKIILKEKGKNGL